MLISLARFQAVGGQLHGRIRLSTLVIAAGSLGLLSYPLASAWVGLVAVVVGAAARWRLQGWPLPGGPFTLSLGLYLAGALVGLNATVTAPISAQIRFFGLLAALATFLLVLDTVTSVRTARRCALAALLATLLAAPLAFVLVAPTLEVWYLPRPLADMISALTSIGTPFRSAVLQDTYFGQRYRLQPSGLGALAAFGVGLALGPALAGGSRRTRLLGWAAVAYFACLLGLSTNRGAMLSALLVILSVAAARYRGLVVGALLVLGCAVGLIVALARAAPAGWIDPSLGLLWWRVSDPASLQQRLEIWRSIPFVLANFAFTGVGLGLRSPTAVFRWYLLPTAPSFTHAHNIFLQSYLEQGPLGFVGLLGVVTTALVVGWRTLTRVRDPLARSAAISAAGAGLALVLSGLTEIVVLTTGGMMLIFAALGLLLAVSRLDRRPTDGIAPCSPAVAGRRVLRPRQRLALLLLAAITLLAVLPVTLTASLRLPVPAELKQPVRAAVASFYLNLGALELARGTLGDGSDRKRAEHLERADGFLVRARAIDPGNVRIQLALAEVALSRSRPAEARDLLDQLSSRTAPDDRRQLFQLGRLYRHAGDVDRAIASWTAAAAHAYLIEWGRKLVGRRQWEQAARVGLATIRAAPAQAEPYSTLRIAVQQQCDHEAALLAMQELTRVYPDVPWPYLEIGDIYTQLDRRRDARAWYRRAAEIAPREGLIWQRLARS